MVKVSIFCCPRQTFFHLPRRKAGGADKKTQVFCQVFFDFPAGLFCCPARKRSAAKAGGAGKKTI